jgi:hypothetical protein
MHGNTSFTGWENLHVAERRTHILRPLNDGRTQMTDHRSTTELRVPESADRSSRAMRNLQGRAGCTSNACTIIRDTWEEIFTYCLARMATYNHHS